MTSLLYGCAMKSLRAKIFILTLIPLILFFLAMMINSIMFDKKRTVSDSYRFFNAVAHNFSNTLEKWQKERAEIATSLSNMNLQKLIDREFLKVTGNAFKMDVYYATDDGKIYASDQTDEEHAKGAYDDGYEARKHGWFKRATSEVRMDDMEYEETVSDRVVSWLVRKENGVLGVDVHIHDIAVVSDDLDLPNSARVLLLNSVNDIVIWSDDDSYRGKNVSELDPVYTSEFINNVLNGNRREFVSYKDKTGEDKWILGTMVGDSKWKVFICLDERSVLSSLNNTIFIEYCAMIIMFIIVFISVRLYITRYISVPVSDITSLISNMNRNHDFSDRIEECCSNDEIGEMSRNMNEYLEEQCRVVRKVRAMGDSLLSSIDTCTAAATNVENELIKQETVTGNVAESIKKMHLATDEISRNSDDVASKVSSIHTLSSNSVDIANNAKESVNVLRTDIEATSMAIENLGKLTSGVASVVGTIREIAEQTNLLALNAAIEAARAGEYGRGFAVVADEVRALSSRTQDSITEIENSTKAYQEGTDKAIGMMNRSSKSCSVTIEWVESIVDKLNEIDTHMANVAEMTASTARSTTVQEQNFDVVHDSMDRMHQSTQEISADMVQCTRAYMVLSKAVHEMREAFDRFKITDDVIEDSEE